VFIWVLFELELSWEKALRKMESKSLFSERRTLSGATGVCCKQPEQQNQSFNTPDAGS
jgi:DNA polymerase III delta subunit